MDEKQLNTWKLTAIQGILNNLGFNDKKKLMAIIFVVTSNTILDGNQVKEIFKSEE